MLVLVFGCHHEPTPVMAHEDVVPELTCPPQPAPSKLRGVEPQQGGYRIVDDDAELERVRAAMRQGNPSVADDADGREMLAMFAALDELRPAMTRCMSEADGAHPELQYELRSALAGNSVATMITGVSVKRIDGANRDGTPVLAPTTAEACVSRLLTRLVLPPSSGGFGESMTIVRQDFCTPTVAIARRATRSYVDAYMTWWRAHPSQTCPAGLAELQGYGRDEGKDPWHQPYVMRCDASGFEVISRGPDRRIGTADDLASHR